MAEERKYREDEVSEIFALATRAGEASLPVLSEAEGLTLGELQDVGREVGLTPERVAAAAAALDGRPQELPRQTLAGAPVSAGRVVDLPRAATDREWQFIVAELRETFGAKGVVSTEGDVREWTNGNLHAVLEETEAGPRLRMGTRKGNANEMFLLGLMGLGMMLFVLFALISKSKTGIELMFPAFFGVAGGGALITNYVRLPRWAGERERQMEHVGAHARALLANPPAEAEAPERVTTGGTGRDAEA